MTFFAYSARSRLINNARFEQMRERDRILKELKAAIGQKLNEISQHPKYPAFVESLIVQVCRVVSRLCILMSVGIQPAIWTRRSHTRYPISRGC